MLDQLTDQLGYLAISLCILVWLAARKFLKKADRGGETDAPPAPTRPRRRIPLDGH